MNASEKKALLEQQQIEDWLIHRLKAIASLPIELHPTAWQLLGYGIRDGHPYSFCHPDVPERARDKTEKAQRFAAQQLDDLPAAQRQQIFQALFPHLGLYMEAAWQLQKRFTYTHPWKPSAFHAPNRPELTLQWRADWLRQFLSSLSGYEDKDAMWLAQWASDLPNGPTCLGPLLAAAIDLGGKVGQEVFATLVASASGEHPIGEMKQHVSQSLLSTARPEGWMALAEAIRASLAGPVSNSMISEEIDGSPYTAVVNRAKQYLISHSPQFRTLYPETFINAHPEAFRYLIRLMLDEALPLIRYDHIKTAVSQWFPLPWRRQGELRLYLIQLADLLAAETVTEADLAANDAQQAYLSLCVLAVGDVEVALAQAQKLLTHPALEHRFMAAYFIAKSQLPEADIALLPLLADRDLEAALLTENGPLAHYDTSCLRERQRPETSKFNTDQAYYRLERKSSQLLLPYLDRMSSGVKERLIDTLAAQGLWQDEADRARLLRLMSDRSWSVRNSAFKAVIGLPTFTMAEVEQLENYLNRKSADLRQNVLTVLLTKQDDTAALASANRLLQSGDAEQRQAGLELLRQIKEQHRVIDESRALAATYAATQNSLSTAEQALLEAIQAPNPEPVPIATPAVLDLTFANGLGLFDPAQRTTALPPTPTVELLRQSSLVTPAAIACLEALDELVEAHKDTAITYLGWDGEWVQACLGDRSIRTMIPEPNPAGPPVEEIKRLPLAELWQQWWRERPAVLRDRDGLELLRVYARLQAHRHHPLSPYYEPPAWFEATCRVLYGPLVVVELHHEHIFWRLLPWLIWLNPPPSPADFLVSAVEYMASLLPLEASELNERNRGDLHSLLSWLEVTRCHRRLHPNDWTGPQHGRLWRVLCWLDELNVKLGMAYRLSDMDELLLAYLAEEATEADMLTRLLVPASYELSRSSQLSLRQPSTNFRSQPRLQALVERCRQRIIEVEIQRGDTPTPASVLATKLNFSGSQATLFKLLAVLDRENFKCIEYLWDTEALDKTIVLSHLLRVTYPAETDTPEQFADHAQRLNLSQTRLVELAMFAPQWAACIEQVLGWSQLAEAVWWFYAHAAVPQSSPEGQRREIGYEGMHARDIAAQWRINVQTRQALTDQELEHGAIDVAWFRRVYEALGEQRFGQLVTSVQYAFLGEQKKRLLLFTGALLGRIDLAQLATRILQKRYQDAVRAIGLLLLPADESREQIILERYQTIQEFRRGSRKFGSERRANEEIAAKVGLENLARTAGFPDPVRLEWAMERQAVADLAEGPLCLTEGEVSLTLTVNDLGEPVLSITKQDRPLKNIPAGLEKQPGVTAFLNRKQEITRQAARMRQSLEQAMCRGDLFTAGEIQKLLTHPVLKPMLTQLVFIADHKGWLGYPVEAGQGLAAIERQTYPLSPDTQLRLAHPYDLLQTHKWHVWQRECFLHEHIQPIKQVFRELYIVTPVERVAGTISSRYAGQQVDPRRGAALLGQRGWIIRWNEPAYRTFHDEGITAWVTFSNGFLLPGSLYGGSLSVENINFSRRGETRPWLPLENLPPRLFSEVMRDLDLLVSVAHYEGFVPDTTPSTVEMRAALVRETCMMLGLDNVRLEGNHVFIEGGLNHYTIHLGSGVIHQQPGGYLCVVPAPTQPRERIFLPFADNDPKTAEIIAKVLLLAHDQEIKDPSILRQIMRKH